MSYPSRRRRALARLVGPAAVLVTLSACRFGAPRGATEQGRDIGELYQLLFYAAIPVAAIVYGLILWSLLRYRRKGDRLPRQTRYHVPLEIAYTLIPLLLVAGLFIETYATERSVDRVSRSPDVVVHATAFQWQWRFAYPELGIERVGTPDRRPTLVLPAGRTVRVVLRATDVAHAFFVPDFLFKRDAIPGVTNRFDLRITEPGVYRGECAEYCGLNHADMTFTVRALAPAEFEAWAERTGTAGS